MNVHGMHTQNTIAYYLSFAPNCNKNYKNYKLATCDLFRGIILIAIIVSLFIYDSYGRFFDYGKDFEKTSIVMNWLAAFVMTSFNVSSIFYINIRNGKKFLKYLSKMEHLEYLIIDKNNTEKANKQWILVFYIVQIFGFIFAAYSAYTFVEAFGWSTYRYFVMKELQDSHFLVVMFNIVCYIGIIAARMKELGQHLVKSVEELRVMKTISDAFDYEFISQKDVMKPLRILSIEKISHTYTTIIEVTEMHNELFGWICVIFYGIVIINLMVPINNTLLFLRGVPLHTSWHLELNFVGFCVFWLGFPLIIGITLLNVSEKTKHEADQIPRLCYSLIKTLGEDDFKLKKELESFGNQADRLKLRFSAGGFFNIDLAMLVSIFGAVFTYIIILMQFHSL